VTKQFDRILLSVLAMAACLPAQSAAAETNVAPLSVHSLESLVSEWVGLRSEIAAETRGLREKKLQWTEEIKLLETEKLELEKEIADADALVTSAEQKRADLLESNRRMQEALAGLEPVLDRAEAELRLWKTRIPASLGAELVPLFSRLAVRQSPGADRGVAERLQVVIALYTQIESLQCGVHVAREVLSFGAGGRREVDVLYMGLAAGFAVSPDNRAAAIGTLSKGGWTWKPRDDLAPGIRKAIAVFNREAAARFVTLPLSIASGRNGEGP
jgi:hypothetical protein